MTDKVQKVLPEGLKNLLPEQIIELFEDMHSTDVNTKIFKYMQSVDEVIYLNDFNLEDRAKASLGIHQGFVNSMFKERNLLARLTAAKESIEEKIKETHKNDPERFKNPVIRILDGDENLQKINKAISEQKEVILFLQAVIENMKNYTYTIKNVVEFKKLNN